MTDYPLKHTGSDNPEPGRPDEALPLSDRMLEVMQTSAVFFDRQGVVTRTNPQARKDLQTERPEGRPVTGLFSIIARDENILPRIVADLESGKRDIVHLPENAIVHSIDKKIQFLAGGSVARLENGNYLFSFRNITNEVTREHLLSMVLARTKIFPWFYDMNQDKMLIDAHWFSYLGIPCGDCTMTNDEFFSRVHPDEREMLADALRRQLTEHEIQDTFAYRLLRGDGTWEWFSEQSMYLSRTADGSPFSIVGVCQSIQDHKSVEETLRNARNKALESDRLKTAFLANMSHEIRTPLNAIVGFSNLLANGEVSFGSPEGQEYAELINKNCDYLITLVSDILDLSRLESDTMDYTFEKHSLNRLFTDIYRKYSARMPQGVHFDLRLPDTDTTVETDAVRVRQVLDHLLDNAVKFTVKGHIDLGYEAQEGERTVRLFVADTGRGISEDQTGRIFERFYKIDSFMQGAGLGLSVCKTISEGLGGTIDVKSWPGEGTCFTLRLPLEPPKKSNDNSAHHE